MTESSTPPGLAIFAHALKQFKAESFNRQYSVHIERGAALAAVAGLDAAVKAALAAWMVGSHSDKESVLGDYSPISSLGQRIRLALVMGLISRLVYHELHIVSQIRNLMAHSPDADNFKHAKVAGHLSSSKLVSIMTKKDTHKIPKKMTITLAWLNQQGYNLNVASFRFMALCFILTTTMERVREAAPKKRKKPVA